jgi:hypothetical protein
LCSGLERLSYEEIFGTPTKYFLSNNSLLKDVIRMTTDKNIMDKNDASNRPDIRDPQVLSSAPSALNYITNSRECKRSEVCSKCEQFLRTACGKINLK